MHSGATVEYVGDFRVLDCEPCGFRHVLPLPDQDLYSTAYYQDVKPDYFSHAEEDAGWWDLVYAERLASIEGWWTKGGVQTGRLLDVGSGPGTFLVSARRRGWHVVGVEPAQQAWAYSVQRFGLDVKWAPLETAVNTGLGRFDAIHLGEVLEHVVDPLPFLSLVVDLLLPGGVLCVVVPNDYSIFQQALRRSGFDPWWLAPPHHLNYFTAKSLHALVRKCGLAVCDVFGTFPMEFFLFCGMNYVADATLGRQAHAMRKRFEIAMEEGGLGNVKREFYRALGLRGLGREIVLFAKKVSA